MYTLGHHTRIHKLNEHSKYMERSQQCIPLVIITMCIQHTQGKMNTVSI